MSIHDDIRQTARGVIADAEGLDIVSPTWIAQRIVEAYGHHPDPHGEWLAIEAAKAIARAELARQFDHEAEATIAYQGDLWTGLLQDRYPLPHKRGEEPAYKRRDRMTREELEFNAAQLRRSADARVQHADALEAFIRDKFPPSATAA